MEETFYIWILPESKKILMSDRNDIPAQCCNLSEFYEKFLVNGNITFSINGTWEQSKTFAEQIKQAIYDNTGYEFEFDYENEAGRFAESEYRLENGIDLDDNDL